MWRQDVMSQLLFRQQALAAARKTLHGDLLVVRPLGLRLLTLFLLGATVMALGFLSINTYARRQAVTGWLEPDAGLVELGGGDGMLVTAVLVQTGDQVRAGQALWRVRPDNSYMDGAALIAIRQQALVERIRRQRELALATQAGYQAQMHKLAVQGSGLEEAIVREQQLLELQDRTLQLHDRAVQRAASLARSGMLPDADLEKVQMNRESHVMARDRQAAQLSSLHQALATAMADRAVLAAHGEQAGLQAADMIAGLEAELVELQAQLETEIVAPVDGIVLSLQVKPGQVLFQDSKHAAILPQGSLLQARLQVPASAIGFIQEGQPVSLRYSAFAYQKFGIYSARVSHVDKAPSGRDPVRGEQVFAVTATLSSQTITAYGEAIPLSSGIGFTADVELDRRSLLEWLLEPVYSLKART